MLLIYLITPLFSRYRLFILKISMLLLLSSNVFSQDDIHINPDIWEAYNNIETATDVESAIIDQYGDITLIDKPEILTVKAPEIADNGEVVPIHIIGNIKAKTIAVFRDTAPYVTVAIINVLNENIIDYRFRLKLGKYGNTKITIIVEAENGNFYRMKKIINHSLGCSDFLVYDPDTDGDLYDYLYHDKNNRLQTTANTIKIRATINDDVITAKFLIKHHTITSRDTQKYSTKENFIKHIVAHVKQKKVCEIFIGKAISRTPYFKCTFKDNTIHSGDKIEVTYTDFKGQQSQSTIIRLASPLH